MISKEKALRALKAGTLYYPASKHYSNPQANVCCDYCNKTHLKICVGAGIQTDLCLKCTEELAHELQTWPPETRSVPDRSSEHCTLMAQDSTIPWNTVLPTPCNGAVTRMRQDSTRPQSNDVCTFMMQDSTTRYPWPGMK